MTERRHPPKNQSRDENEGTENKRKTKNEARLGAEKEIELKLANKYSKNLTKKAENEKTKRRNK